MALVVMPVSLAFLLLPRLGSVYAELPASVMLRPFVYGAMWGVLNWVRGSPSTGLAWDLRLPS